MYAKFIHHQQKQLQEQYNKQQQQQIINSYNKNIKNLWSNSEIVTDYTAAGTFSLNRPMLSAVENHMGPGRGYNHHYSGGPSAPPILPHCPMPQVITNVAAMSAEFARPHPKPRLLLASQWRRLIFLHLFHLKNINFKHFLL